MCPSEAVNQFYSQFINPENIFNDYSESWIEQLMTRLIKINVGKKDNESAHILLILDDCVSDVNFHSDKAILRKRTRKNADKEKETKKKGGDTDYGLLTDILEVIRSKLNRWNFHKYTVIEHFNMYQNCGLQGKQKT